jgi:hypothetical protein
MLHLVVQLPDGSPGTIPAAATNIWGDAAPVASAVVLDVDGLRTLRQRVEELRPTRCRRRVLAQKGK